MVKRPNSEIKQAFDILHSKALRIKNTQKKDLTQLTFL